MYVYTRFVVFAVFTHRFPSIKAIHTQYAATIYYILMYGWNGLDAMTLHNRNNNDDNDDDVHDDDDDRDDADDEV